MRWAIFHFIYLYEILPNLSHQTFSKRFRYRLPGGRNALWFSLKLPLWERFVRNKNVFFRFPRWKIFLSLIFLRIEVKNWWLSWYNIQSLQLLTFNLCDKNNNLEVIFFYLTIFNYKVTTMKTLSSILKRLTFLVQINRFIILSPFLQKFIKFSIKSYKPFESIYSITYIERP